MYIVKSGLMVSTPLFFRLDFGHPEVCIDIERKMILNKQISWEEKSNSYIKHNVAFSLVSEENRHNLEILLYRATYYRLPRSILSEAQKMYWYFLYHLFSQTKINPFFSFRETQKIKSKKMTGTVSSLVRILRRSGAILVTGWSILYNLQDSFLQ